MGTLENAFLGVVFWVLGLANTLLMFKLWGYPFDHERHLSSAPRALMLLHRLLGYAFVGIYAYLMVQMVPRLWAYQVELPARTVLHLALGVAVGTLLLVKILIVRFFKHLEGVTAPFLGILLLTCTSVLLALSEPVALREAYISRRLAAEEPQAMERVRALLAQAGLPPAIPVAELAHPAALARGRAILLRKCVHCHDLRPILAKPRPPEGWAETVRRMAERAIVEPIPVREQWHVTAYLVAISPDLQQAVRQKRQAERPRPTVGAGPPAAARPAPGPTELAQTKALFEGACNGCHAASQVEGAPPRSEAEARRLVARMVDNGLSAEAADLERIARYLARAYAR